MLTLLLRHRFHFYLPKWNLSFYSSDILTKDGNPKTDIKLGYAPGIAAPGSRKSLPRCESFEGLMLTELETMFDHVHLLVGAGLQYGIHRLVKEIKGRSSRWLA